MNPGQLKHRITIQESIGVKDELGQIINETWQNVKTVWSKIETLSGREYFAAVGEQLERSYRFVIRYTTGLYHDMRIVYEGRTFEIKTIINDGERNKTLTIVAVETG